MTQMLLPLFDDGMTLITPILAYQKVQGEVHYFFAGAPIFQHREEDVAGFRMITSQFVVNGWCKQMDIVRAFGLSSITMKRAVKLYREEGVRGFYRSRKAKRQPRVLTPEVVKRAEGLLEEGMSPKQAAAQLEVKEDTLSKAIRSGRIRAPQKKRKP